MLILIFLSNSFFNSFMKMKNEKWTVFRFPFFYENEKRMRVLKIQSKTLLNMKMVVKYLNFVFHIEVKTKSNYKILNFVFQFIKNMKWHFGYSDIYGTHFLTISHLTFGWSPEFFIRQISFDNSVSYLYSFRLNDFLWFEHCFLKVVSQGPK